MPKHQINKDATFAQQCMNRFHGVNELYNDAMEKEINGHKSCSHWHVAHRDTLPAKAKAIKAI
eukprot:12908598-Ditylum_brightwellii.AAC.1